MSESKTLVILIKIGEKEVLIRYLETPIWLRKVDEMIKYARLNEIRVKGYQQRKDEIIKLLNEYQMW